MQIPFSLYPETFDHFTTNSKKLCTMKLNMFCTIVKDYTRTSMTEVDTEMIAEYRAQFADLQRSFNVKRLVNHLNSLQDKLLPDKLDAVDSWIADGTPDAGYIGDDLFRGPWYVVVLLHFVSVFACVFPDC